MNRRKFLRQAGVGVGASGFVGLTPINPLHGPSEPPESSSHNGTPISTQNTATRTSEPNYHRWRVEFYGELRGLTTDTNERGLYVSIGSSVYRFDIDSGELRWEAESEQSIETPVGIGTESVFAAGRHGRVLSLDRATGERLWFESTDSFSPASPIVYDGTVIVPGQRTQAFDIETAEVQWSASEQFSSPLALQKGQHLYLGDGRNSAKIDMTNGSVIWSLDGSHGAEGPYFNLTIWPQRSLFIGTNGSSLYANNTKTGDLEWTGSEEGIFTSLCLFQGQLIYVVETDAENSKLGTLELTEGDANWENIAPLDYSEWKYGNVSTKLFDYNDHLLAGTSSGHLFTIDPISGDFQTAVEIMDDGVLEMHLSGDRAYLTSNSTIQAVDLSETPLGG